MIGIVVGFAFCCLGATFLQVPDAAAAFMRGTSLLVPRRIANNVAPRVNRSTLVFAGVVTVLLSIAASVDGFRGVLSPSDELAWIGWSAIVAGIAGIAVVAVRLDRRRRYRRRMRSTEGSSVWTVRRVSIAGLSLLFAASVSGLVSGVSFLWG